METTQKETIKAASIARYIDKVTKKLLGFGVKSNHTNDYYCVRFHKMDGKLTWTCTCKAGEYDFVNCKDGMCCHVKAVLEVAKAKKENEKEQALAEEQKKAVEAVEAHLKAERKRRMEAPLNSNNQGFSLLKV